MRASFRQNTTNEVELVYYCQAGHKHVRVFRTNVNGHGYIREHVRGDRWQQVGEDLAHSGNMLSCSAEQLLSVIRREWARTRRAATSEPCLRDY